MISPDNFTIIGLPYHGLRTGYTLVLEDGHEIEIAPGATDVPSNGSTWLWQHPNPPGATRTDAQQAADVARHYTWKTYEIHPVSDNTWPFVDAAGTVWRMELQTSRIQDNQVRFRVFVRGRWGVVKFHAPDDPIITKQILSQTVLCTWADASQSFKNDWMESGTINSFANDESIGTIGFNSFSQNGAIAIINLGVVGTGFGVVGTFGSSTVTDIIRIDIAGTGSMDPETFGDGITATLTKISAMSDLISSYAQETTSNTTGSIECTADPQYTCGPDYSGNTESLSGTQVNTTIEAFSRDFKSFHWVNSAGTIKHVRYQRSFIETTVATFSANLAKTCQLIEDPFWGWVTNSNSYSASISYEANNTVTHTVGDDSMSWGWSATHSGPLSSATTFNTFATFPCEPFPESDLLADRQNDWAAAVGNAIAAGTDGLPAIGTQPSVKVRGVIEVSRLTDFDGNRLQRFFGFNGGTADQTRNINTDPVHRVSYHPVTQEFAINTDGVDVTWV